MVDAIFFILIFILNHRSYWGDIITQVNAIVLVLNGEDFGGIFFHLSTDGGLLFMIGALVFVGMFTF